MAEKQRRCFASHGLSIAGLKTPVCCGRPQDFAGGLSICQEQVYPFENPNLGKRKRPPKSGIFL
jgi:hypothetical protein